MPPPDVMAKFDALAGEPPGGVPFKKRSGPLPGTVYRSRIKRLRMDGEDEDYYEGENVSTQPLYATAQPYHREERERFPPAQHASGMIGNERIERAERRSPPRGDEKKPFERQQCIVPSCSQTGKFFIAQDGFGGPGYRCGKHGRTCVVKGCYKPGKREMPSDEYGDAGLRCMLHGGGQACGVPGCEAIAWRRKENDKFGPAGLRCSKHAQPCNVDGCTRAGQRRKDADRHGPEGYRCNTHCHA